MDASQQDVGQKKSHGQSVTCESCEREVPAEALHCPHCCGQDGRRGTFGRGTFTGGVLGLMVGGVGAAVLLSFVGPEYNTWSVVSGIVLCCIFAGAVLGVMINRRE